MTFRLGSVLVLSVLRLSGNSGVAEAEMASKRIQKELKDLQKDPPTSCSAVCKSSEREEEKLKSVFPDDVHAIERPQSDFESYLNIGVWFNKYCKLA